MFRIREKFVFDESRCPALYEWKYPHSFLAGTIAGWSIFYLKTGRNAGNRALIARSPEGLWGWAPKLHDNVLLALGEELESVKGTLRLLANCQEAEKLWDIKDVPGFSSTDSDSLTYHHDKWYTSSLVAAPLPPPSWAPDAQAWSIREGVYIAFPDDSFRLARGREYHGFPFEGKPVARQGDCLIFSQPEGWEAPVNPLTKKFDRWQDMLVYDGEFTLDRHHFEPVEGTQEWVLTHPEHKTLRVQAPEPGLGTTFWAALVPGTSRPFGSGENLD
ncbi:hypothetical protein IT399_00820 [Candidatus Nomurabacteria bacterium]|nr:hypothetical protein [Candidatus Nomurabacteria bacterium]